MAAPSSGRPSSISSSSSSSRLVVGSSRPTAASCSISRSLSSSPPGWRPRSVISFAYRSTADGPSQLLLVHAGAAFHTALARLVVELLVGGPARPVVRTQTAAAARRDVVQGGGGGFRRLTGASPLLVHGPSRRHRRRV